MTNSNSSFGAFASGSIVVGNHIRTSGQGSINLSRRLERFGNRHHSDDQPQSAWDSYVSQGAFGRNGGSVFVGFTAMARHVEVGSRFGDTNVAGYDISVTGSGTAANNRYAMIGFHDSGQVFAPRLNRGTDGGATEIRLDMRVGAPGGTGAWLLSDGRNSTNMTAGQVTSNQAAAGVGDPIVAVAGNAFGQEVDLNGDGIADGVRGINSTGIVSDSFVPYANHYNSVTSGKLVVAAHRGRRESRDQGSAWFGRSSSGAWGRKSGLGAPPRKLWCPSSTERISMCWPRAVSPCRAAPGTRRWEP